MLVVASSSNSRAFGNAIVLLYAGATAVGSAVVLDVTELLLLMLSIISLLMLVALLTVSILQMLLSISVKGKGGNISSN
jgi:hypothetical protein